MSTRPNQVLSSMTPQLISAHSVSAFIVAIVSCLHPAVAADNQRPNFVVIYTDDLQHGVTGFTGHPRGQLTPVLDAAAASGTVFTDAHVVYALCGPSRAALLSGKYGSRNGMMDFQTRMKPQPTFVSRLRDDGYQTNVVGKWHINLTPEQAGFQTWTTFHGNGPYYNRTVNDNGTDRTAHKLIDEFCTDISTEFLRRAAETNSPFLLLHATQLPHMDGQRKWPARPESLGRISPGSVTLPRNWNDDLAGKPPYLSTVRNRRVAFEEYGYQNPEKLRQHTQQYHAVTTEMDSALAPLFATLRETGLDRNTYVFMMSDNGWMMGEHGMTSKMLAYEACTRVPFFVSGPGIRSARCDELVLNIDIAPTVLDIAGLPVPERMQGRSLVPLLNLKAE
ncbi:MAG: sulfatase-like hydrolase/transferase, partial [Planctomycetaceae bacterium]|nr:sulfatase-like hydrolase/transferase [Planctomycetaceae bacterium]